MKCPVCQLPDLLMTERQGIEIDYCPQCRGVWLDRGELDKLIERSSSHATRTDSDWRKEEASSRYESDYRRGHDDDEDKRRYEDPHRRKRRGLLGELFDFD